MTIKASLLLAGLISNLVFAQVSLQYTLQKGEVYLIGQTAEQQIIQEAEGAEHQITNSIEGILEFRVMEVSDSGYAIDVSFRDLNLNMVSSIQGELLNVHARDSSAQDMQARIFHSLLDIPVRLTLARTGEVLEVRGGDSLVARMTEAAGLEDAFSRNLMTESLLQEFGSNALSESYEQFTFIYPEKVVRKGEHWKNVYQGRLMAKNNWTLEDINGSEATIRGQANVIVDVQDAASGMNLNGTQETRVLADLKTGFIKEMSVTGISTGSSSINQLGGQQIPTTIRSSVQYKILN